MNILAEQQLVHPVHVRIVREHDMACIIEDEAAVLDGPAPPTNCFVLFEQERIGPKVAGCAEAGGSCADHHVRGHARLVCGPCRERYAGSKALTGSRLLLEPLAKNFLSEAFDDDHIHGLGCCIPRSMGEYRAHACNPFFVLGPVAVQRLFTGRDERFMALAEMDDAAVWFGNIGYGSTDDRFLRGHVFKCLARADEFGGLVQSER